MNRSAVTQCNPSTHAIFLSSFSPRSASVASSIKKIVDDHERRTNFTHESCTHDDDNKFGGSWWLRIVGERGKAERLNGHLDLCGVNTRRTSKSTLPWPLGEFWLIDRANYHETAHPNPTHLPQTTLRCFATLVRNSTEREREIQSTLSSTTSFDYPNYSPISLVDREIGEPRYELSEID